MQKHSQWPALSSSYQDHHHPPQLSQSSSNNSPPKLFHPVLPLARINTSPMLKSYTTNPSSSTSASSDLASKNGTATTAASMQNRHHSKSNNIIHQDSQAYTANSAGSASVGTPSSLSTPGSQAATLPDRAVPLPHEDFEPYFNHYASEYDSMLAHQQSQTHTQGSVGVSSSQNSAETYNMVKELGIPIGPSHLQSNMGNQNSLTSPTASMQMQMQMNQSNGQSQLPSLPGSHTLLPPFNPNTTSQHEGDISSNGYAFEPSQIAKYSRLMYSPEQILNNMNTATQGLGSHLSANSYYTPMTSPTKNYGSGVTNSNHHHHNGQTRTLQSAGGGRLKRKSMPNLHERYSASDEEDDDAFDEDYSQSSSPSPKQLLGTLNQNYRKLPPIVNPGGGNYLNDQQHMFNQGYGPTGGPSGSSAAIAWQPIITAPQNSYSQEIIKMQQNAGKMSSRKSCLPPGKVDSYMAGPNTEGMFECLYPNCGKLFRRRYNVRSHIQTHLCDRPYGCEVCGACFVRPHDLRRHEKCHRDERPFVCPCGKGFSRHDALQRHRMRQICIGALDTPGKSKKSPQKRGRPRKIQSMVQLRSSGDDDMRPDYSRPLSPLSDTGLEYIKEEQQQSTTEVLWAR